MPTRMYRFFLALQHETYGPVSGKPVLATIVDNWWLNSNASAGIRTINRDLKPSGCLLKSQCRLGRIMPFR
ncbi:MAG TPA: hypothetical protein VF472_24920 [Burkholderiaceae bacterium]